MPERYITVDGSDSGHCCFEATVIDTKKLSPDGAEQQYNVCECLWEADATTICAALNGPDEMDTVAINHAHKLALHLECILADYSGPWYEQALQSLGEYRSAMDAIHERESPTFMGEPVLKKGADDENSS